MRILGTVFALSPGDSALCSSVVSLERMLKTLGFLFFFFDRQIVPQTACVHRMTDRLEVCAAIHVTSKTGIPLPFFYYEIYMFSYIL